MGIHFGITSHLGLGFIILKINDRTRYNIWHPSLPPITDQDEVHDHRYDFSTKVVRGRSMNTRYRLTEPWWNNAERFEAFDYMTPLNGGGGFTWRSAAFLTVASESLYGSHCRDRLYLQGASEIHTIKIVEPDTILRLVQYEDVRPLWEPTRFFARAKEPPALDGLYNRFTADEVLERLSRLPEGDPT